MSEDELSRFVSASDCVAACKHHSVTDAAFDEKMCQVEGLFVCGLDKMCNVIIPGKEVNNGKSHSILVHFLSFLYFLSISISKELQNLIPTFLFVLFQRSW